MKSCSSLFRFPAVSFPLLNVERWALLIPIMLDLIPKLLADPNSDLRRPLCACVKEARVLQLPGIKGGVVKRFGMLHYFWKRGTK